MNRNLKVHIIGGTGQMGNWLRNFLESQRVLVSVSGSKGVEDSTLKSSEIIFVSVPISKAKDVILDISKRAKRNTLIVDLSSVQQAVAKTLSQIPQPAAGLHLLFGPTVSSIQNQKVVLSVIKKSTLLDKLKVVLKNAGAEIIEMSSKSHDLYMAHLQNLTHFVNLNLAKVLLKNKIDLGGKVSTPPFLAQMATLSRVISQPPELLTEIQLGNSEGLSVLNDFIKTQQEFLQELKNGDREKLHKLIEKIHRSIDSTPKGTSNKQQATSIKQKDLPQKLKGKIAYLGPQGTFSHQISLTVAKESQLLPCENFLKIFEAVKSLQADFGIVPAENSTEGTVRETLDFLIDFDMRTNGSLNLPIQQNLLSEEKSLKNITKVYSHPQALAQCRNWLREHLPNVNMETASSTVSSIKEHRNELGVAFISPLLAAKLNNIPVLRKGIEDNKSNVTKFYVISKDINKLSIPTSRTLLFLTVFNRVGILRDILNVFASSNINLSKIESRPSREKVWDYHFFIEVEVSTNDERMDQALNILKQYCPVIKVIGGV
ncbi:hypothetical protein A2631_04025 [Candidatus Daviesbacteria bacterium RIFCSPHIGHO2_01_FULL_44_29]|uniref:Prephenate dehydratase n=1 Tax=Candidatus Daviesbacteria bacterium RIFCSPHIGHO2_02_FULL_43_12 TaxID=1797776 RepID=A0A1F5KG41_9BACT|nr:MAG: hypothetical protein A2631_04025 [Candidatus Daviesbacteria bacterium RIFCSPHIGHO2_01_FULL_44_29]OGE39897.1 MAG: hypothetical protein A3D25_03755 [Candidatus Daviesbacteria bacterium RIFCSPHIGHO2_02_FULL_43_12]OGE40694.1 MAG: hypothetical protein A3E86_04305 [Candidatus Daviesbacteria bacterium RIFCSPHIGHO2_12_FULL_47_45]OGE70422.1 MAG: hypothetical protein A3B55_01815 [Candidatus Daviesbacteria bacterium RIFCSPLOWO2_01_FULL_43_15]